MVGIICFLGLKYPALLTEKDPDGEVPLHYAAANNAAMAAHYLAAFMLRFCHSESCKVILFNFLDTAIDVRNQKGRTPLHLAVELALEQPHETAALKNLLILGASRDCPDGHRLTPRAMARGTEVEAKFIKRERYCRCCLWKMPLRRVRRSWGASVLFLALLVCVHALQVLYFSHLLPASWLAFLNIAFFLLTYFVFVLLCCREPVTLESLTPYTF